MQFLEPEGWPRPKGYANGVAAEGRMVFVAGQVGWNAQGVFAEGFAAQFRQTLENTVAVLAEAGAAPKDIVRMTWYVTDREAYDSEMRDVGAAYRDVIGRHYPAMAVVQVVALMEREALVEIETTAVIER
jgi:enamine deaminase RidA (YjgF/YER057c/UK114 family)